MEPFKSPAKIFTSADTVIGTGGFVAAASPSIFNLGSISTLVAILVGVLTCGFLISRWVLWSYNNREKLHEINQFIWGLLKSAKKETEDKDE